MCFLSSQPRRTRKGALCNNKHSERSPLLYTTSKFYNKAVLWAFPTINGSSSLKILIQGARQLLDIGLNISSLEKPAKGPGEILDCIFMIKRLYNAILKNKTYEIVVLPHKHILWCLLQQPIDLSQSFPTLFHFF